MPERQGFVRRQRGKVEPRPVAFEADFGLDVRVLTAMLVMASGGATGSAGAAEKLSIV